MSKFTICTKVYWFCFPAEDKNIKYWPACLCCTDKFVQFSDLLIYSKK